MDWKIEEDTICCEVCVYEYVIQKNDTDINSCIEKIKQHASIYKRSPGSIKQRIQNIKYWINELCIENTIPLSPLSHAAKQTKKVLIICLENAGCLPTSSGENTL